MDLYTSQFRTNNRIEVADALRGIAVVGIILYHALENFNVFFEGKTCLLPSDDFVMAIGAFLLSGKMYGIFAVLFGLSFFIMRDNQEQKGNDFSARFAWRMVLLFLIGLVNIVFYDGDILTTYAVFGLIMIPCAYLPNSILWLVSIILLLQPTELYRLITEHPFDVQWVWNNYGILGDIHTYGGFIDSAKVNLQLAFSTNIGYFIWSGRITQIPGLFLLGVLLGRYRFFYNEGNNLRIWAVVLVWSLLFSLAGSITDFGSWSTWFSPMVNLAIMSAEVSLVVLLWYYVPLFQKLLGQICFFGRMSLSNYLLQSILGSFIFYNWGLGWCTKMGATWSLLIGITMVIIQILILRIWERTHKRGPMESLWRWGTWI